MLAAWIANAIPADAESSSDAERAVAEGHLDRAFAIYKRILASKPDDVVTLRDAGRIAYALAQFSAAADLLTRADAEIHAPDPELHFMLGEALWTLGRVREARIAHGRARKELSDPPTERLPKLWLAKIAARFGDVAAADQIYDALIAADAKDAEAALAQAELHAGVHEWARAGELVRRFLATTPDHRRAQELLAWIEEAQGHEESELALRKKLATGSAPFESVRDYGRALERGGDWAAALAAYRRAHEAPGGSEDIGLRQALERVERRMSPELAAGMTAKSDPGAVSFGAFTGVALPFGRAHHVAVTAWNERASHDIRASNAGELSAAVAVTGRAVQAIGGAKLGLINGEHTHVTPGAFGTASTTVLDGHLQLAADAELDSVWRESPRTILEGGIVDSAAAHVYGIALGNRLVIDSGVQVRRLRLEEQMDSTPVAKQALIWTGADYTLWTNFASQAAGESLDDTLLHPTYLADSAVISYRHYEMWGDTDATFAARMSLADRATIDEVSVAARKALARGRVAVEARAGGGRDWAREVTLSHVAASLWLAPSSGSRLTLSLELTNESTGALSGQRQTGWMGYHVDL